MRHQGRAPSDYSTNLFARHAVRFVSDAREPFFAMVTPYAPHAPAIPAPGDADAFADEPVPKPANFNVAAAGGPAYYRNLPSISFDRVVELRRRAWASTLAVDDAVRRLVATVAQRGVLDRTLFVYLSDNGFSFGSHRYMTKNCLYEECAHVPLGFLLPGGGGGSIETPISNVDLAPTLAHIGGAEPPAHADGTDLAPELLGDQPWPENRNLLLEVHQSKQGVPDGYAVVGKRWKYARHETGKRELYDLEADPYELRNLSGETAYGQVEQGLRSRLRALRR